MSTRLSCSRRRKCLIASGYYLVVTPGNGRQRELSVLGSCISARRGNGLYLPMAQLTMLLDPD